ncbi:MAG TPA: PilN domain-containing protein [Candidatus Angelobacter sp.]|nr:PilN domain-containing protein [Candidatus Angelobacter sp.]
MRLNINLASQRYEDVRRFYLRWGTATAVLAALTVVLLLLAYLNYSSSTRSRARIHELQQKIAQLQHERDTAATVANSPENRDVTEQKNYWNMQIMKRRFSWTQLFNDLQKIMPGRAYVNSVQPELTQDHRLKLRLTITGEKYENALDLVKRMETSPRFRQPQIGTQNVQRDSRTGASFVKFEIETYYTPSGPGFARTASKEGM